MHEPASPLQPSPPASPDFATPALRSMFAARKRVFVDLLGWELPIVAGHFEVDRFDDPLAQYLLLTSPEGSHRGSTRLLHTDCPHLLGELYPQLCPSGVPAGPTIREITRFCLDPALNARERRATRNQLVTALAEHALAYGISAYTGIAARAWFDQIARFGWSCVPLGPGVRCGNEELVALHITIDKETIPGLIAGGVYEPPARLLLTGGLAA